MEAVNCARCAGCFAPRPLTSPCGGALSLARCGRPSSFPRSESLRSRAPSSLRESTRAVRASTEPPPSPPTVSDDTSGVARPSRPVEEPVAAPSKGNMEQRQEGLKPLESFLGTPGVMAMSAGLGFLPGLDLAGPGSVIEAMSVLALIVTVHELGHFLAARSLGIHVTKFAIGFGPTVFKYQEEAAAPAPTSNAAKPRLGWMKMFRQSTPNATPPATPEPIPGVEYSLRLIPLGGYVAFPDDEENNTTFASDDPDLLQNRPLLDRIIVVSAGVVANFIFAYSLLFTQVNTIGIVEQTFQPGVTVPKVIQGGAGDKGGLMDGDIILEVQGKKLSASEYSVLELVTEIKDRPNAPVKLVVERGNGQEVLTLRPTAAQDGTGRINVQLTPHVEARPVYAKDFLDGASLAWSETIRLGSLVTDGLRQLFLNFGEAAERLSGPVAIVAVGAEVARTSAAGLFQFAAIVNLNLAVVNILPLPALDGGFLLLLLLEGIRGGKKLPQDVERAIMSSGLLLLLTAGVFLIVRDTLNLGIFSNLISFL